MKKLLALIIFLILNSTSLFSQWQPDVRLTNDPAFSLASFNNAWSVATSGNVVHVVWRDQRDGNDEIYYKRSTDGGINWGTDTRLTNDPNTSRQPSIAVSGSIVHVVWPDDRDSEIHYKRSTDGGVSWGEDTPLTNTAGGSGSSSVSVSGSVVHVVWNDFQDFNNEIYYKRSTDGGVNWSSDTRLTNDPATSWEPSIAVSGSVVHVVWWENREGNNEIYYKRSTDGGVNWGADTRLTNNSASSETPFISVSDSVVHIVWNDDRDGNGEIYYRRSTDAGVSWGVDTRLTNNSANSRNPSVAVSGTTVHVVWPDQRDGNDEIYYKSSTDGGVAWGADIRLTNNVGESSWSSVTVSGSVVHVVWNDKRDGNFEIYYKRNPDGNVTGIEAIASDLPEEFLLNQNYPNPFNPVTNIRYAIPQQGYVTLKIYDILGNEIATLVNEEKSTGTYEVQFDASLLSSGVYLYKIQAGEYSSTKKMTLLK